MELGRSRAVDSNTDKRSGKGAAALGAGCPEEAKKERVAWLRAPMRIGDCALAREARWDETEQAQRKV